MGRCGWFLQFPVLYLRRTVLEIMRNDSSGLIHWYGIEICSHSNLNHDIGVVPTTVPPPDVSHVRGV